MSIPHEKLTVVLPIKDRPDFTTRWLQFANAINMPFHVVVADGSAQSSAELINNLDLPHLSFSYRYCGPDSSAPIYLQKIADALNLVETDYVCLVDDDDFQLIDGYFKSIKFLDSHQEYVGCGGQTLGLFMQSTADFTIQRSAYKQESLSDSEASERIKDILKNFRAVFYDVYRTEVLKDVFSKIAGKQLEDLFNAELFAACLVAAAGKLKKLETPFLIRHHNNPQSGAVNISKSGGYFERSLAPRYYNEISGLFDELLTHSNIVKEESPLQQSELLHYFKEFMRQRYVYEFPSPIRLFSRLQKLAFSIERLFSSNYLVSYIINNLVSRFDKLDYKASLPGKGNSFCSYYNDANSVGLFLCRYYVELNNDAERKGHQEH